MMHTSNVVVKTVIVMGNMDMKIGTEHNAPKEIVGQHGLGDMWVEWCATNEQVIMNGFNIISDTWKRHGDGVENQIDYININRRFRNSIQQVNHQCVGTGPHSVTLWK